MARRPDAGSGRAVQALPSRSGAGPLLPWLALALLILVTDQISKFLILANYVHHEATVVTSFFNLVRVHNAGAAFSFLAGAGGWQRWLFTALGLSAAGFIVWLLRAHAGQRLFSFALSCILGGAIGNVIDRLLHGYVVDMLDFHWAWLEPIFPAGHFPAFNVADMAISVGAAGLILDELLRVRRGR